MGIRMCLPRLLLLFLLAEAQIYPHFIVIGFFIE